jgi:hypothetical protein
MRISGMLRIDDSRLYKGAQPYFHFRPLPITIGYNCWIAQNVILNAEAEFTMGNNVCIAAYSQLWTHVKFGDSLERCRFCSTKPMIVEDGARTYTIRNSEIEHKFMNYLLPEKAKFIPVVERDNEKDTGYGRGRIHRKQFRGSFPTLLNGMP